MHLLPLTLKIERVMPKNSPEVERFTQALESVARKLGLKSPREYDMRGLSILPKGYRDRYIDLTFLLPVEDNAFNRNSIPLVWFEIDQDPDRAAQNSLKLLEGPVDFYNLPIYLIGVHFGFATEKKSYGDIWDDYVKPSQWIKTINIQDPNYEDLEADLLEKIEPLLKTGYFNEGQSVLDVCNEYQEMLCNGALAVVDSHLRANAIYARFLASKGEVKMNFPAVLWCARGRILQRAGFYDPASQSMEILYRFPNKEIYPETFEQAITVKRMLNQPEFGSAECRTYLEEACNNLNDPYLKSRFLWRIALDEIARKDFGSIQQIINKYEDMVSGSTITETNIALIKACRDVKLKKGDPLGYAIKYRKKEKKMFDEHSSDHNATLHGLFASLYLETFVRKQMGSKEAKHYLQELDSLRRELGVSANADGLRELRQLMPLIDIYPNAGAEVLNPYDHLRPKLSRKTFSRLVKISSQIDDL